MARRPIARVPTRSTKPDGHGVPGAGTLSDFLPVVSEAATALYSAPAASTRVEEKAMAKDGRARRSRGRAAKTRRTVKVSGAVPYQPKMSEPDTRAAVDREIGQRVKLADYRSTITPLTPDDRELMIDQALQLLDKMYAHLPLKRALHANDPIQSL